MKIFKKILIVIIILTVSFIWYNSLQLKVTSNEESGKLMVFFKDFISILPNKIENFVNVYFRKLAHFFEFFTLGTEIALFTSFFSKNRKWYINAVHSVSVALYVAVIDESFQMMTDRSPEIKDVLIDFSGSLLAVIIIISIIAIYRVIKRKTSSRN